MAATAPPARTVDRPAARHAAVFAESARVGATRGGRCTAMRVEFRMLGDVEVLADGRRLDVGHARQRCVLASLLVDVNRPVSVDRLIDRVWGDEPPHKARNAVAAYVSRLRQVLAGLTGVELVRSPAGYVLRAPEGSVDLAAFRQEVTRARAASGQESLSLYDAAIARWRGDPLIGIDTPWANEVRTSLVAERLSAVLDRNDAALAAGRHSAVLGELTQLAHAHQLDERIAGQLMLALYRSGRQAEALETFQVVRRRLVDELGVDPGPALQAVHRRVLDGEPAPPTCDGATARRESSRSTTRLIGRREDVARAAAAVEASPVVTLVGVGGVGKTALAIEVADIVGTARPLEVSVCELAPLADGAAIGQVLAAVLGLRSIHTSATEDAVIDLLRHREQLLVVDNCEHVLDDAARIVDRISRECTRVTVLATSREPLGVAGERVLPVQPLSDADAAELFAARARASRPDFDPAREPVGAVAEICRRVDGIPLAIELAAARMRAMTSIDIARRLDRLRLLSGGKRGAHPRHHSVTATIDWSYRLLSADEQRFFAKLSVFAGGFDVEAAHAVCAAPGTSDDDTLDLLISLVDKSMVVVRAVGERTRYDVLETLRAYGRERLLEHGLQRAVGGLHAHYYVRLLERAADGLAGPDEAAWVERIAPKAATLLASADLDNVRIAFDRVMADGDVDLALRLVNSLPEVHVRIGYHSIDWVERAVQAADPEHPLFAAAVGAVARGCWVLGQFDRARDLADLAADRAPGASVRFIAHPADVLADVAMYEGDVAAALDHYERALVAARASTDARWTVWVLDKITTCHQRMGAPERGVAAGLEAVALADRTRNPTVRALARIALGRALSCSDPARALALLREGTDIAMSVENTWPIITAHMECAVIHAVNGDPIEAARMFVDTLDIWEKGGPTILAQQWDALAHVAALLARVDATVESETIHRALTSAGRTGSLHAAGVPPPPAGAGVRDPVPDASSIVAYARKALQRLVAETD